jgi:two-component system, cell cycle sensor histidine kinase and response regulator CckA
MNHSRRILIVDDQEQNRLLLEAMLKSLGYESELAASGAEALDKLDTSFDLVLLDILMPEMDGYEVARRIRDRSDCPNIPIVVVTALSGKTDRLNAVAAGANDFISKPIDRMELQVRVASLLKMKEAQDALKRSEERYRAIVETASDTIWAVDLDLNYTYVSPAVTQSLGYTPEEVMSSSPLDAVTPASRERILAAFREEMALEKAGQRDRQRTHIEEVERYHKDGTTRWAEIKTTFLRDAQGTPVGILGISHDITDRKRMEEELRHSQDDLEKRVKDRTADLLAVNAQLRQEIREREKAEKALEENEARYRTLFENIDNGVAIYRAIRDGEDFVFVDFNRAAETITGVSRDQVLGKTVCEVFPGVADFGLLGVIKRTWQTGASARHPTARYHDSDIELWTENLVYKLPSGEVVAVFADETERKRAEHALRTSEEKYRVLVDKAPAGVLSVDLEGRILEVNPKLLELMGSPSAEATKSINMLTFPLLVSSGVSEVFARCLATGQPQEAEKPYTTKWGKTLYLRMLLNPVFDQQGRIQGCQAVMEDVTRRKEAEEANLRLATAVEQAAETITITDAAGTIVYVNPAFERTTGYSRQEAVGSNPRILKSGEHDRAFYQNMWQTITSGNVWHGRLVNKKKDGTLCHEEATISPIKDDTGNIVSFVAVKRDVTQEVSLQKQLFQAQKMEAIGTLAGGIAHDFNNLLQVTLGYSELLLQERTDGEPDYEDLRKIFRAAKNGAELVQRLLTFSRRVDPQPLPMDLNQLILQVDALLRRTIPKMIQIQLDLAEDLLRVNADPTQMEQVIMNLAVNARDAMPEGGTLTIATRNLPADDEYCLMTCAAKSVQCVAMVVSDTGHGMDRETVEHMFEPFFTTKELGRGTGLGLAMVYGIVQQHSGHVRCDSEVGKGTAFHVVLPAIPAEEATQAAEIGPAHATEAGTVLVVDDEEFVRELGARVLEKAGYTVLQASNGEEALEICKAQCERIDLVIMDLIMPGMGGRECLTELLRICPQLNVMIASGYSGDASVNECLNLGAKSFVNKPFRVQQLLEEVRSVLDAS